jgi:peroxiredoxin
MKKLLIPVAVALMLSAAAFAQTSPTVQLKVGDTAPDFSLSDTTGTKVKLSDFRGKSSVVLAFYVFAFTGG